MKRVLIVSLLLTAASVKAQDAYNPFDHYDRAMNVLLGWGGASMVGGSLMLLSDNETLKWSGAQHLLWGAIDLGIALGAKHFNDRDRLSMSADEKIGRFRRLMVINGLLDIAYIGTGVALMKLGTSDRARGSGMGIVIQGGFLFGFDWINYGLTFRR